MGTAPTYTTALDALRAEHRGLNESALRNLDEDLEEALTVHRLGVGFTLRRTLMTTNLLESIIRYVEQRTGTVDRWRSSTQKHSWVAVALLDIEPRLRRVRGYRARPQLREAPRQERTKKETGTRIA